MKKSIDFPNGDHYEGEVNAQGVPHGNGYMSYKLNGYVGEYEGEWRDGKRHGHGVYEHWSMGGGASHSTKYEGEWLDDKENGYGVETNNDQTGIHLSTVTEIYRGEFKNGKRHGYGKIECDGFDGSFANGKWYFEGEFKDGQYNGHGIKTMTNGSKVEGEFVNGNLHGHCIYTDEKGRQFEGDWDKDDLLLESYKSDSSPDTPSLVIVENISGFGYYEFIKVIVVAQKGRCMYEDAYVVNQNSYNIKDGYIDIKDFSKDSVTYNVREIFLEQDGEFVDTIHRGEKKEYSVSIEHTGRMYDDDFTYTSDYSLRITCI